MFVILKIILGSHLKEGCILLLVSLINLFIFLTHCTGWSEKQLDRIPRYLHAYKICTNPEPNSLSKDACDPQTHPQASHGGRSYSAVPTLSCSTSHLPWSRFSPQSHHRQALVAAFAPASSRGQGGRYKKWQSRRWGDQTWWGAKIQIHQMTNWPQWRAVPTQVDLVALLTHLKRSPLVTLHTCHDSLWKNSPSHFLPLYLNQCACLVFAK